MLPGTDGRNRTVPLVSPTYGQFKTKSPRNDVLDTLVHMKTIGTVRALHSTVLLEGRKE